MTPSDHRQYAPATQRNREPILEILQKWFPKNAKVLEIASGTGEHGLFFSQACPDFCWQPSDINPLALKSIQAWQSREGNSRFLPPLQIDMCAPNWWSPLIEASHYFDVIVNINMIHISPWEATIGLLRGSEILKPNLLYFYGPFKENGNHTSESNQAFDHSLRSRNPSWGVRDLEELVEIAHQYSFQLTKKAQMPANNLSVLFART